MKRIQLFAVAALFLALGAVSAEAQNSASASTTADAIIVKRLKLTWHQHLNFGILIPPPPAGSGTATIDISGIGANAITTTAYYSKDPDLDGGVSRIESGVEGPATFHAEGSPGYTFAVTLPPITALVDPFHLNGDYSEELFLDRYHTNLPGSYAPSDGGTGTGIGGVGMLIGLGVKYFAVGARVTVPYDAANGTYSGQFDVAIAYN